MRRISWRIVPRLALPAAALAPSSLGSIGSLAWFGLILPVNPINRVDVEIRAYGLANRGKNLSSPNWENSPKRLSLSLTGSFISAMQSLMPALAKV